MTLPVLRIHRSRVQHTGLLVNVLFVHEVDGSPLPTGGAGGRCAGGVAEGRGADGCRRGGGRNPKQFGFSPSAKNIV